MKTSSYIEWCNENEARAYPLSESASRVSDSGAVLPDNVIADLGIVVPEAYADLRVSSVYVSDRIVSVAISSSAGGLLLGSYARATLQPYMAYPLTGLVDNVTGWIVFGNHKAVTGERYRFSTAAQSGIEARAVRFVPPPGVVRFLRKGGSDTVYAGGLVKFDADTSFNVFRDPGNPQNIIVELAPEARTRFIESCSRESAAETCGVPPIRRIATVPADAGGTITLRFD